MSKKSIPAEVTAAAAALGRLGAAATVSKYKGTGHFKEIGRKGGETMRGRGIDYAELGRRGARKLLELRGPEYMAKIGARGGAKVRERGISYYEKIGTKGGAVSHQRRLDLEAQLDERVKENKE